MTPQPPVAPGTPAPPAGTPPAGTPPPAGDDLKAMKAELETLKGKVADGERTAQFWYEKAQANGGGPAEPAKPKEDTGDDVDLLDVLTTKGVKGLLAVLKQQGVITKDEASEMVNSKATQLTTEAQLIKDYPELKDKKSEFFQITAEHYGQLKAKGVPEEMAMSLAAERTDLQLLRAGKRKTPTQVADDDKSQREKDRKTRIAAQSGDRGGRAPEGSEEDDELTDAQKNIAIRMLAGEPGKDGKPMSHEQAIEAYKERAKKGVAMRGVMR